MKSAADVCEGKVSHRAANRDGLGRSAFWPGLLIVTKEAGSDLINVAKVQSHTFTLTPPRDSLIALIWQIWSITTSASLALLYSTNFTDITDTSSPFYIGELLKSSDQDCKCSLKALWCFETSSSSLVCECAFILNYFSKLTPDK